MTTDRHRLINTCQCLNQSEYRGSLVAGDIDVRSPLRRINHVPNIRSSFAGISSGIQIRRELGQVLSGVSHRGDCGSCRRMLGDGDVYQKQSIRTRGYGKRKSRCLACLRIGDYNCLKCVASLSDLASSTNLRKRSTDLRGFTT